MDDRVCSKGNSLTRLTLPNRLFLRLYFFTRVHVGGYGSSNPSPIVRFNVSALLLFVDYVVRSHVAQSRHISTWKRFIETRLNVWTVERRDTFENKQRKKETRPISDVSRTASRYRTSVESLCSLPLVVRSSQLAVSHGESRTNARVGGRAVTRVVCVRCIYTGLRSDEKRFSFFPNKRLSCHVSFYFRV